MKANFPLCEAAPQESAEPDSWRAKALEAICGSMVFVEGTPLYWDILDDE